MDWKSFKPGEQLVNVVQGVEVMCLKASLVRTLKNVGGAGFMPLTEIATTAEGLVEAAARVGSVECEGREEVAEREGEGTGTGGGDGVVIIKPSGANQGTGIVVCKVAEVPGVARRIWRDADECAGGTPKKEAGDPWGRGGGRGREEARRLKYGDEVVIQAYIMRPMLITKRKFDIRTFCLICSVDPPIVLKYSEFYLRRSCEPYATENLGERAAHLTNVSVQKHHVRYIFP